MLFDLLIGLLIYRRNPRSNSALGFLILTATFALWLGSAAAQRASEGGWAIFWNQAQYAGAALIIVTFTYFTKEFLKDSKTILNSKIVRWTLYSAGLILALFCFSGTIITNKVQTGTYIILGTAQKVHYGAFGPAYLIYNIVFVLGILVNIVAYLQSMVKERSPNRKKGIMLILLGALLVGILGTITDLILPMFGFRMPLADVLTVVETGFIAIAMVWYKVFDIGKSTLGQGQKGPDPKPEGPFIIVPTTDKNEDLKLFAKYLDKGLGGIVITTLEPEKVRPFLKGHDTPIVSLSDIGKQKSDLDPTQFNEIFEALAYFLSKTKGGVVLFSLSEDLIARIITSYDLLWTMVGYFKKMEALVKQGKNLIIITRRTDKEEALSRYPDVDQMLLSSQIILGPLQKYGFLEPLFKGLTAEQLAEFKRFFLETTDKRYKLVQTAQGWTVSGLPPTDRQDIIALMRALYSTLKFMKRQDLMAVLLGLGKKVGIQDSEVLFHPGGAYIIIDEEPKRAFTHLYNLSEKTPCLCIIKSPPDKISRSNALHSGCKVLWMTAQMALKQDAQKFDFIKPHLEHIVMSVLDFLAEAPKGAILIEGIDHFIAKSKFDDILRVCEKLIDEIWLSKGILIVPINPKAIDEKQLALLKLMFEEA
jgi:hypothetical protein